MRARGFEGMIDHRFPEEAGAAKRVAEVLRESGQDHGTPLRLAGPPLPDEPRENHSPRPARVTSAENQSSLTPLISFWEKVPDRADEGDLSHK